VRAIMFLDKHHHAESATRHSEGLRTFEYILLLLYLFGVHIHIEVKYEDHILSTPQNCLMRSY
jgi:hypothetical protein